MAKYFADLTDGRYLGAFEGPPGNPDAITAPPNSVEVPGPPDHADLQTWDGAAWVDVADRAGQEAERDIVGAFEGDKIRRLVFEIEYDQENRLRVLEGKPIITKVQYRDALKTLLKTL